MTLFETAKKPRLLQAATRSGAQPGYCHWT